jgi:hypothetical protein
LPLTFSEAVLLAQPLRQSDPAFLVAGHVPQSHDGNLERNAPNMLSIIWTSIYSFGFRHENLSIPCTEFVRDEQLEMNLVIFITVVL